MTTPAPPVIDDDDRPIGRILTRREALAILGTGVGGLIVVACAPTAISTLAPGASSTATSSAPGSSAGASLPSCIVKPELTEGPYFVDEKIERSDIRSDSNSGTVEQGAELALGFAVSRVSGNACVPFEGALVDVWHCNAAGEYSDVEQNGTVGRNFLRGYQVTDTGGNAAFSTIYPGWYRGRTPHIHFKIRTDPQASSGLEFTSQLFFDEAVTAEVYATAPYLGRGTQDTTNATDTIFTNETLLTPVRSGSGYAANLAIGVVV
jgi:protocatechuate 3,4-dioxygenase beta subunit